MTAAEKSEMAKMKEELGHRFCHRCDYCQPCSQEISIQMMMGLQSVIKRFGAGADALQLSRSVRGTGGALPGRRQPGLR